jgi:hypothetical protein
VRAARAPILAIVVGVAALARGSLGQDAIGGCAGGGSCLGARLPAPVTIATGHVRLRIARDGSISRAGEPRSSSPQDAVLYPGTGVWFISRAGHLVVGRGRTRLWRSHGEFKSRYQVGLITAGSHAVAFQHDHTLYLGPLRGAERPIASRELPLGWTSEGLYTYSYPDRALLLRSDAGRVLKVIARRPLEYDYDLANGGLYFLTHRSLMTAHGERTHRLASLVGLGMSPQPWLQPLGRLLELEDNGRLVVLRGDGSVFASTALSEGVFGPLATSPDGRAVAFISVSSQRAPTTETVSVLRQGAHAAVPVHRERVLDVPCAGEGLEWHGRWLLYNSGAGKVVVIDSTGSRRSIELSGLPGIVSLAESAGRSDDSILMSWTA